MKLRLLKLKSGRLGDLTNAFCRPAIFTGYGIFADPQIYVLQVQPHPTWPWKDVTIVHEGEEEDEPNNRTATSSDPAAPTQNNQTQTD